MTPMAMEIFNRALAACGDKNGKAEAAIIVEHLCELLALEYSCGYRRRRYSSDDNSVVD